MLEGIRARVGRRWLGIARRLSIAAKAMAAGGASAFAAAVLYPGQAPGILAMLGLAGMAAVLFSPVVGLTGMFYRQGKRRRDLGTLSFDGRTLELIGDDGLRSGLSSDMRSGVITPVGDDFDVILRLGDGNELSLLVDDLATAERLLDLVGLSHESRRTRVRWGTSAARLFFGGVGFAVTFVASWGITLSLPRDINVAACGLAVVAPFLAAGALSQLLAWREVEVGTDGISWKIHGKRSFLALRDVARVSVVEDTVIIHLVDGTDRRFDVTRPGYAEGLRIRIASVLEELGGSRGKHTLFGRAEDSFAAWKERMRTVLDRGPGFRQQPVDVEDTVRVLEDPSADAEMRIGAALALRELGDPAMATRVRVVADTCVSPKLRVALSAAAEGELEEDVVIAAREEMRSQQAAG